MNLSIKYKGAMFTLKTCGLCTRNIDIPPFVGITKDYIYQASNWKALLPFMTDGRIPDFMYLCQRCNVLLKKHRKDITEKIIIRAIHRVPGTTI